MRRFEMSVLMILAHLSMGLIISNPLSAQSQTRGITDPAECSSRAYVGNHDWSNQDVDSAIAVCASEERIGTRKFVDYWKEVMGGCAEGKEPIALWNKLSRVPFTSTNGWERPQCEGLFKMIDRLGVPLDAERLARDRKATIARDDEVIRLLRRNAEGGSPAAQFLLASILLDIENVQQYQGPHTSQGVEEIRKLVKKGYSNEVFKYVDELQRRFPAEPAVENVYRHRVYLQIYGSLAQANDPRGHVKLAEEYLKQAHSEFKHGNHLAMRSPLNRSRSYLERGKSFATGKLLDHINNLEFEVRKLENSPTTFHLATSAFISGSAFLRTWQLEGLETAINRVEDCRKNRPAVDVDPTLRLAFSFFGCIPY